MTRILFALVMCIHSVLALPHEGRAQWPEYGTYRLTLNDFTITDADTIRIKGARKGTRLVGYNAPERNPSCRRGRLLRDQAEARFANLVRRAQEIELELVRCACRTGTAGTDQCNYGRSCGILRLDGRDVADIMVREGLAARFACGDTRCPKTPKPWC